MTAKEHENGQIRHYYEHLKTGNGTFLKTSGKCNRIKRE